VEEGGGGRRRGRGGRGVGRGGGLGRWGGEPCVVSECRKCPSQVGNHVCIEIPFIHLELYRHSPWGL
jgi:hypothetical protein